MRKVSGKILDPVKRRVYSGTITINNGKITDIIEEDNNANVYILPGLIDAHLHIESSMLIPTELSKILVKNGTVAVVNDPHEIANVMGEEGIKFMMNNADKTELKCFFTIPSCVPATSFESSGASLSADDIDKLLSEQKIKILGEMMNFPGVIFQDKDVIEKLNIAKKHKAKIDGHAPGLSGENLEKYISYGISTDHECTNIEEATEKIKKNMSILIREGSAAKNFDNLYPLISKFNKSCMLCTDDSHPDDLIKYGHINNIVKKAISKEIDIFDIIASASLNAVKHYNLPVGLLQVNDPADFIIVDDLENFNIIETSIDGKIVYNNNRIMIKSEQEKAKNNFNATEISKDDIILKNNESKNNVKIIEVIDKEIFTKSFTDVPKLNSNNEIISDTKRDILKIVVLNRYEPNAKPAIGLINGFGIKKGAIASSVAHDSHNIVAVGADDEDIYRAINEIIDKKGGLTFVSDKDYYTIPLEFAGLMTQDSYENVASKYEELNKQIKQAGCNLTAPFMTLSFMPLLVIPELKIGDRGLFDVNKFSPTDIFV